MRKLIPTLAVSAGIALSALVAGPAQAADPVAIPQTRSCSDGSGVNYTATISWNYWYRDRNNTRRASVSDLDFGTNEDTDGAAIDNRLRVYSFHVADGLLHKIQDRIRYEGETDNDAGLVDETLNPKNPTDHPGHSQVTLVLGTDGDGLGNCKVTFVEPFGLDFKVVA